MQLSTSARDMKYPALHTAVFQYPAIDNHAHPFLKAQHKSSLEFEGLISEAQGDSLTEDSIHTLACFRATRELGELFQLDEPTWETVKTTRENMNYDDLCRLCMKPTGIQCILIDDGLGGVSELAEGYKWHDQFTSSPTKRIVRIEVVAQDILKDAINARGGPSRIHSMTHLLSAFTTELKASLTASAADPEVVGFKSVACYRTGLDISTSCEEADLTTAVGRSCDEYGRVGNIRLSIKPLNDFVVRMALEIAGQSDKPVQFHTGLGDNDITLTKSSPAHMQPIIEAFPQTKFVLLHSSYPYTRDAGYLTAVYRNVYLDFGEVFPFVSGEGQRAIVRQVLELCPTNKIMWSTDGHWWPESYYLGTIQARDAMYEVLADSVRRRELTEKQAASVAENALFHNANKIYSLGLEPQFREA